MLLISFLDLQVKQQQIHIVVSVMRFPLLTFSKSNASSDDKIVYSDNLETFITLPDVSEIYQHRVISKISNHLVVYLKVRYAGE